jgi:hypothetical protein
MTRGVLIFWLIFVGLISLDYAVSGHPRVEPAPFAFGSGQASSGGHCSGR